ncbi:MAG: glyoxalase [Planctomycetota bacterium]|nr:MAG: glyoxalase [Planctomycetota bacterium]
MQAPTRTGSISYVQDYAVRVPFYHDILDLEKMFHTEALTSFNFGGSDLLVEVDDEKVPSAATVMDRIGLRMNVADARLAADALFAKGVKVDYQVHAWGTVAKFRDSDGNLCAFKDDLSFEKQVAEA